MCPSGSLKNSGAQKAWRAVSDQISILLFIPINLDEIFLYPYESQQVDSERKTKCSCLR